LTEEVQRLKAQNEALSRKCSELETELATVKTERDDYAATVDEFIKDHKIWLERALTPEKRDRILNALGVGKQAPLYKRIKVVLDQFVNEA
jgi:predicted  nucleic acid-binding Zn-ribbon protein